MSRSTTSSPIGRPRQRSGSRTACAPARPSGHAMRPSSRTTAAPVAWSDSTVVCDDRLERLLEVERLRDRLGDPRERLELVDPAPRLRVELRVLDRLPDLRGDRREQRDLCVGERPRLARADVERALEHVAGEDRDREDRLVLVLTEVRERLEARVEMRAATAIMIGSRSAAATPVIPSPRRMRGALVSSSTRGAVRRPEDELVGPLVVEVDEARVRLERGRDLVRDRLEHLLEVERGVDDLGRAGQEREVACRVVVARHES